MNVDDVYGSLYSPFDGLMDPHSWCTSLTKAGTQRGGRVVEDCPVTAITTVDDGRGYRKVTGIGSVHVSSLTFGHVPYIIRREVTFFYVTDLGGLGIFGRELYTSRVVVFGTLQ